LVSSGNFEGGFCANLGANLTANLGGEFRVFPVNQLGNLHLGNRPFRVYLGVYQCLVYLDTGLDTSSWIPAFPANNLLTLANFRDNFPATSLPLPATFQRRFPGYFLATFGYFQR
jgi:hypothetical protein